MKLGIYKVMYIRSYINGGQPSSAWSAKLSQAWSEVKWSEVKVKVNAQYGGQKVR